MRVFRKGKKLDGFRIESLLNKNPGRIEYVATRDEEDVQGEYRVIVYDMGELPVEYIWASEEWSTEGLLPFERHFLEKCPLRNYPSIVGKGGDGKLQWLIIKLAPGLTIREYIAQNGQMPFEKALKTAINLCSTLETITCFDEGKAGHYNVTPDTVRIQDDSDSPVVFLEGFGFLSMDKDEIVFTRPIDKASYYLAPELFIGCPSIRSDVYGVSLILYMLLTGKTYPWNHESMSPYEEVIGGRCDRDSFVVGMGRLWNTAPDLTDIQPRKLKTIIYNGISTNPNRRTESVVELQEQLEQIMGFTAQEEVMSENASPKKKNAGGFSAVAGLGELKRQMMRKFILPIRQRKLAKAYKITPPNGCLLYGPPGCGKTFIAEHIAEEAGIQCVVYRPSDIASIYVHGGQDRIKSLFEDVRKHAPIMVCFDEADAFVSSRTRPGNEHYAGEVNEFLTQLNNAAKDGVYVFFMTNNPDLLDPAVLRTGRVDEKFYIPMPDSTAREEFFRIRLRDIPTTGEMNYALLAKKTEGMTFSDLDYVVTESCRTVFLDAVELKTNSVLPVTQSVIEESIASAPKSVSIEDVKRFESFREMFSERLSGVGRRKIGFV